MPNKRVTFVRKFDAKTFSKNPIWSHWLPTYLMHKYRTDLIDHHHLFVGRRLPMRQNEKSFICFAMRHKPINDNWIILKVHCIDELQVLISY